MKIVCAILCFGLLASTGAFAADAEGNFAVWGLGQASCNAYNKARAAHKDADYKTYLMGYLTAFNTITPHTARVTGDANLNTIMGWLDKYCHKSVVMSYEDALHHLAVEMNKGKTAGETAKN